MSENLPAGVEIDKEAVRFSGSARLILLQLLMKAKFDGEPNSDVMFNPWLSGLLEHLQGVADGILTRSDAPRQPYADDPKTRFEISQMITAKAAAIGWWGMTDLERRAYLRSVVAAPRRMSDATIEEIVLSVDEHLDALEDLVEARRRGRSD